MTSPWTSQDSVPQRLKPSRAQALTARSGRTMARTGLRMMPTSPSSPLKFRTAGFPQYGFKAGCQKVPSREWRHVSRPLGLHPSFVLPLSACRAPHCVGEAVRSEPPRERLPRSTPGVLAPDWVVLSRSIIRLIDPIRPTRGHSALSLLRNLYALPSLCVSA